MQGLEVRGLEVSLGSKQILHQISLRVGKGELVSLLGPSGCGKSTLLKTIAGILSPDCGEIRIDGESVVEQATEKRGAVIVFQDLRLFPNKTVAGNIEFALKLQRIDKKEREKAVKHLLQSVKLSGFEKRKINQLSGGQMQRVALARAVAAKPRILLLDEPFSSLDEELREEMRSLVLSLHREYEITILLVTHDKNEALFLSDRIALMIDGKIIQCATPKEIYQFPLEKKISDYFGGCSYLCGEVKGGIFSCKAFSCAAKEYANGTYDARIRPSMIKLEKQKQGDWRITDRKYQGEKSQLTLSNGEDHLLVESVEDFCLGERFQLQLSTEELLLFPHACAAIDYKRESPRE